MSATPQANANPLTALNVNTLVGSWAHKNSGFLKDFLLLLFLKGVASPGHSESSFTSKDLYDTYELWFTRNSFPHEAKYKKGRTYTLTAEKMLIQSGLTFSVVRSGGVRFYYGLQLKIENYEI